MSEMFDYQAGREAMRSGGLRAMGWRCSGGSRTCPECVAREQKEAS